MYIPDRHIIYTVPDWGRGGMDVEIGRRGEGEMRLLRRSVARPAVPNEAEQQAAHLSCLISHLSSLVPHLSSLISHLSSLLCFSARIGMAGLYGLYFT